MKKYLVLVVVLVLVGTTSWAQTFTGQWLHDGWLAVQKMETGDNSYAVATAAYMFMGFVFGEVRVMQGDGLIDTPQGVSGGQELAMLGAYLDEHLGEWNVLPEILIYKVFHAAWPKAAPNQ